MSMREAPGHRRQHRLGRREERPEMTLAVDDVESRTERIDVGTYVRHDPVLRNRRNTLPDNGSRQGRHTASAASNRRWRPPPQAASLLSSIIFWNSRSVTPNSCQSAGPVAVPQEFGQRRQHPADLLLVRVHRVGADDDAVHSVGMAAGQIARQPPAARIAPHGGARPLPRRPTRRRDRLSPPRPRMNRRRAGCRCRRARADRR